MDTKYEAEKGATHDADELKTRQDTIVIGGINQSTNNQSISQSTSRHCMAWHGMARRCAGGPRLRNAEVVEDFRHISEVS